MLSKKSCLIFVLVLISLFIVTACSSETPSTAGIETPDAESKAPEQQKPDSQGAQKPEPEVIDITQAQFDPTTLIIMSHIPSITHETFERIIEAPIKSQYPQYTLDYRITGEVNMEDMIIAGDIPDIVITSIGGMNPNVVKHGLEYDVTELINKYNYDLTRIEPSTLESMRNATGVGALYGMPYEMGGIVMFYNKALFDQFGVPHPTNGMTWDEAHALARQMTRTADGVNYRGMSMFFSNVINGNPLSLPLIDPNENKASVNNDGFKQFLTTLRNFYDIPGNRPAQLTVNDELNNFYREQNIAMVLSPMSGFGRFVNNPELDWDMVATPTYPGGPGFQGGASYYFITNNGKQDQAFQAVSVLLGDEVQLMNNRDGKPTILVNEDIRKTLGEGHPIFSGKNFSALFYNDFAPVPPPNIGIASTVNAGNLMAIAFREWVMGGNAEDVNTMLRNLEERINQEIAAAGE